MTESSPRIQRRSDEQNRFAVQGPTRRRGRATRERDDRVRSRPCLSSGAGLAGEKRLDRVPLRLRILLTEVDQRLEIVGLEEDEADDVGAGRPGGAEAPGEIAEESGEARLEAAGEAA